MKSDKYYIFCISTIKSPKSFLLKDLSNFWRSLDLPLINYETDFIYHGQKIVYCQNIIIT